MADGVCLAWLKLMLLLNYRPVLSQPTGIGVYANEIFPAFEKFDHKLISGGMSSGPRQRLGRLVWSQISLPKLAIKYKADLIFTPAPEGYLGRQTVPQVVTVHDLRPLYHPECSMQSLYFKYWVPPLLDKCKHIVTNSEFTANQILSANAATSNKLSVIPLGYDSDHFNIKPLCKRLHPRPYLLHIGQAYPHKNIERLIRAFALVVKKNADIDLLLVGKPHKTETPRLRKIVDELGLQKRVFFKPYTLYENLPDLYRGAEAFVYPSLWEGFGLPILESLACGTPVITSHGSGTEEASGGYATLVDPMSIESIAHAIKESINLSSHARMVRASASRSRLKLFTWDRTRKKTSRLLETLH